jgi:hypothetical protein
MAVNLPNSLLDIFGWGAGIRGFYSSDLTVCLDRAIPDAPLSQVTQQCSTIAPKSRFATVKKSQEVFSSHFREQ